MFEIGLIVEQRGESRDVLVELDEDGLGESLYEALAPRIDVPSGAFLSISRNQTTIERSAPLASIDLRWGDRLSVEEGTRRTPDELALLGWEGPSVGLTIPLAEGSQVLGRGTAVGEVFLTDPLMSRRHVEVTVGNDGVVLQDLGSSNGTLVDGVEIQEPTRLPIGHVLQIGDSSFLLSGGRSPLPAHLAFTHGVLRFNRHPRLPDPDPVRQFEVPSAPEAPPKRKLPLISAVAPLLMAGVLVLATGGKQLYYLFIAGLSPVILVFNVIDDRRSGRKAFAKDSVAYKKSIVELRQQFETAMASERAWAARRWPDIGTLRSMVARTDAQLWWRRPSDSDFLDLRVGECDQASRNVVHHAAGGEEALEQLATEAASLISKPALLPAVISLKDAGVVGLAGERESIRGLGRWVLTQVAAAQSERDVAVCVIAPDGEEAWDALKWLPHVRSLDPTTPSLAFTEDAATSLFASLRELVHQRRTAQDESFRSAATNLPQVVLLIEPPVALSRRIVSEFLREAPSHGVSVIWLAPSRGELPGECASVVEVDGRSATASLWTSDAQRDAVSPHLELLDPDQFLDVTTALAPLRDVTASSGAGPIPLRVDLLDLLGLESLDGQSVLSSWKTPPDTLRTIIGHDGEGAVELDLELDGPHGLVAGTTGSGKSELLQTLVSSLAATHPPSRVNFILVDYKGGSAFKSCAFLPHTVGLVTDLDGRLAQRALRSLEAELERRERLITVEGGAKDLEELRRRDPQHAPPSLVVVVDEFAFLAKEVPEFVDRLVDVAQRGRSLGVHLLLATQRPTGVIGPHIQANTTLRIALRVSSAAESSDIIDRSDAVTISNRTRGRAYLKTGNSALQLFQCAFVGGDSDLSREAATVASHTFHMSSLERRGHAMARETGSDEVTDLDRLVACVQDAFSHSELPTPHVPWQEPLGAELFLDELPALTSSPALGAILGLADLPGKQAQESWALDLGAQAHWLIYGQAGSGKTSALRSLAVSLASSFSPSTLFLYGIDYGNDGLQCLEDLDHWGGRADGREIAKVQRLLSLLADIATERRRVLAEARMPSAADYRKSHGEMAEIIVLLDNFGAFAGDFDSLDQQPVLAQFHRLLGDGRALGIHFVMTADRYGVVPSAVASLASGVFALQLTNAQDYLMLGLSEVEKTASNLPAGRGFTRSGTEVQLGKVGNADDAGASDIAATLRAVERINQQHGGTRLAPILRLLPSSLTLADVATTPMEWRATLGIDERFGAVQLDLQSDPLFLVVGPARSGRSTALSTIASGLRAAHPEGSFYLVATRKTPLREAGPWVRSTFDMESAPALLQELVDICRQRAASGNVAPLVIVIDDAEDLSDGMSSAAPLIDTLQKSARDANMILLVSVSTFKAQRAFGSWLAAMKENQHGLLLAGNADNAEVFQGRLPKATGAEVPPGRGYVFTSGGRALIQVAR